MVYSDQSKLIFIPPGGVSTVALQVGFRFGEKGTHSSRTIMLSELKAVLSAVPPNSSRKDYATAIIDDNCLGKPTASTRQLTNQRLGELYALDPFCPIFRTLRHLWDLDQPARPLLALLTALARDPLLLATAPAILTLPIDAELQRSRMRTVLKSAVGSRLKDSVLGKVARNAASSWTQAGHLEGRTFKKRRRVQPTPITLSYAFYLAHAAGFIGEEMLSSGWVAALDCSPAAARGLALDAKRLGLISLRLAGDVFEIGLEHLDPGLGRD